MIWTCGSSFGKLSTSICVCLELKGRWKAACDPINLRRLHQRIVCMEIIFLQRKGFSPEFVKYHLKWWCTGTIQNKSLSFVCLKCGDTFMANMTFFWKTFCFLRRFHRLVRGMTSPFTKPSTRNSFNWKHLIPNKGTENWF